MSRIFEKDTDTIKKSNLTKVEPIYGVERDKVKWLKHIKMPFL